MNRDIYQKLLAWKDSPDRKPLLLQGARQVGKTYILRAFAKKEFKQLLYINFEKNPELKSFFEGSLDPVEIIHKLSIYFNQPITNPKEACIFFDEIQECPPAITSLKYFYEETPEYTLAAAGSLLGVKLSQAKSFPVGKVNFLSLKPLNFLEFLEGIDKKNLRNYLENISLTKKIDDALHVKLMEHLKIYLYVGGMPEAVMAYKSTHNVEKAREVQNEILKAYLYDFAKHAPSQQVNKITSVFEIIPANLARENKKFIFSAIAKSARAREYESAIQWLIDAGLIYQSYNVTKPTLPLEHYIQTNCYKIFLLDVGLLGAMCRLTPQTLLSDEHILTEFKGALMENFVAQEFVNQYETGLFYWHNEGNNKAEIDFLINDNTHVIPVEVKANISKKKKSLHVYQTKFNPPYTIRISARNIQMNEIIRNFPLYLTSGINKI